MNDFGIQKLFRSVVWKISVVILLALLFIALFYLIVAAHFSIEFVIDSSEKSGRNELVTLVSEVYLWGLISVALLLFIVGAGVYDLMRTVSSIRRFRILTQVIEAFAGGDHSRRFKGRRSDDGHVQRLGTAFNNLATELEQTIAALRTADIERRELIAHLAHDLGTPLTSIRGYVETILLGQEKLSIHQQRSYLTIIDENSRILSNLVSELLDLVRLDDPIERVDFEKFPLDSLVADVASRFCPVAEEKGIKVVLNKREENILYCGDIALIERAISNVIDNALKFTPEGGQVQIEICRAVDTSEILITVTDTGIGIPSEDVPRVFDKFFRGSKARTDVRQGSGIGLSLVKRVVTRHGGRIGIQSTPGTGTAVIITLPANLEGRDQQDSPQRSS